MADTARDRLAQQISAVSDEGLPQAVRTQMALAASSTQLTALPVTVNLRLYAGDDFTLRVAVSEGGAPADLDGAVPRSHIRTTATAETIAGEFDCSIVGSAVIMVLSGALSATLPAASVYDCEIVLDGRTITLVEGAIQMTPQVTR